MYALFSCPEEMFSLDPVVALGGGIHLITGLSVDEHDFCNVASLVIKRKECVSAYSHIYLCSFCSNSLYLIEFHYR